MTRCLFVAILVLASGCGPGLSRLWEVHTGDYSQTPAVAPDGTLISTSYDAFGGDIRFAARDPADGAEVWSANHESGDTRPKSLDAEGNLIVNGRDRVFALDPTDGSETWSLDDPGTGFLQAVGLDRIFLVRQDQGDNELLAADGGEVLWRQPLPDLVHGIAVGADGTLFVAGTTLSAWDPDGVLLWEVTPAAEASALALAPGKLVVDVWSVGIVAFDRADGEQLWSCALGTNGEPSIAADGTIYAPAGAGLAAIDGSTGDVLWDVPLSAQPVAIGSDGRLYTMAMLLEDEDLPELGSKMHFVVVDPADGEVLWQEWQNESVEGLNFAPSFDRGRIYFGAGLSLAHVYAFSGAPALGAGPWPRTGADNSYSYREQ